MTQPPRRLADDPEAPPSMRDDLARARESSARPYDAGVGAERFGAWVTGAGGAAGGGGAGGAPGGAGAGGGGGAAGAGLAPSATVAVGAAAKWSAVVVAGTLSFAVATFVLRAPNTASREPDAPASRAAAARAVLPASQVRASSAAPGPTPPAQPIAPPATSEPAAAAARSPLPASQSDARTRVPIAVGTATTTVDPDAALRREIAALGEARAALASHPARALELATRGQAEFRAGMFREEREAIAVFALRRLGRHAEARRRAEAFLARYPDGPFSEQIRQQSTGARSR